MKVYSALCVARLLDGGGMLLAQLRCEAGGVANGSVRIVGERAIWILSGHGPDTGPSPRFRLDCRAWQAGRGRFSAR